MDFIIEESNSTILIRQKWKYEWLNAAGTSAWTFHQKQKFHRTADVLIWNHWGNHFKVQCAGTSDFAQRHAKTEWDVNFDIKWVKLDEHWKVKVTKIPSKGFQQSRVKWNDQEIHLDTEDVKVKKRTKGGTEYEQYPLVHEFGHAIGNSWVFSKGDEYKAGHTHLNDRNSIMNVGGNFRDRHLWFVIDNLDSMILDTGFTAI